MPRFFTLTEAEQMLPSVERRIREILAAKATLEEAQEELRGAAERISLSGGAEVDPRHIGQLRARCREMAERLQYHVQVVHEGGCLIKDLDLGLVDFPTLFHGKEVYLCWKLGEKGISFWHAVEDGFRGRKPIDREFLDHHTSDPPKG